MTDLRGQTAGRAGGLLRDLGRAAALEDAPVLGPDALRRIVREDGTDHIRIETVAERVEAALPSDTDPVIVEAILSNLRDPPPVVARRALTAPGARYSWARHEWSVGYVSGAAEALPRPRGRPPIDGEPRSADHRVRCTPSALERWRLAADAEGVELAEATRDLLDEWSERVLTR